VTVDSSRHPAKRSSKAADFGARLLEVWAERIGPGEPIIRKLHSQSGRLLEFLEDHRR
jgi:hypothetical protein